MTNVKKFIFAVITYNHSKYIIEHLESIKYLIENYGVDYTFKLVVADDGSKDNTVHLINFWLKNNAHLFKDVVILSDGINRGTCVNYTNLWQHIDSSLFKITAGDDVYSFENLFAHAEQLSESDYISGLPLILIDQNIIKSNSTIFHMLATDIIYKNRAFVDRLRQISVINTPSLLYNFKFIKNIEIYNYIRCFKVTEDFPMMVKIATLYANIKFKQSHSVLVYYRRTAGSIYLVRRVDFDNDKLKNYKFLLKDEKNWLNRLIIQSRIQCYLSNNKVYKIVCNLSYWIYLKDIVLYLPKICGVFSRVNIDVKLHQNHYNDLKYKSDQISNIYRNDP